MAILPHDCGCHVGLEGKRARGDWARNVDVQNQRLGSRGS